MQLELCNLKGDKSKLVILRNILKAEEFQQRMFNELHFIRGKYQKWGIVTLEVLMVEGTNPKQCNDWKVVGQKAIMECLLERNRKHFGQTEGSPFSIPPLAEKIDFMALTAACKLILEGNVKSKELEDLTTILLHQLSK
jgi:hypothetical protein